MSDPRAERAVCPSRLSIVRILLVTTMGTLFGILLVTSALGRSGQAAVTVTLVFAEAIFLYVGYAALIRISGPILREYV